MKKKILLFFGTVLLVLFSLFVFPKPVFADPLTDINNQIAEYQKQIDELEKQKNSLSQQISLMDKQIQVATLKILQTETQIKILEQEIGVLSGKIVRLEDSLDFLSKALLSRVTESYKRGKIDPLSLLFLSKNFSQFINNLHLLQTVQLHDRTMLLSMETTRTSYDDQKQLKVKAQADLVKLQKQLVTQKQQLNSQIADRKRLLEETKGKEANYQKLLAQARAELEAISGILAGNGTEKEMRKVSEGERIASLIPGESCNSSGTHLHFIVYRDNQTLNPFNFLKSVDYENCSGSRCGSTDGDPFNPSGNWNWPLNPKIQFNQGYGYTWAIQHTWVGRIYNFHNGIDLQSDSLEVKAVKSGTLYWGSYIGNCVLRYVKVHHDEEGYDTYYLHINY